MNYDINVANSNLNDLFDCSGAELEPAVPCGHEGCPLAMVYGVDQQFRNINDPSVGLAHGTIFADLDLPFKGSEGGRKC